MGEEMVAEGSHHFRALFLARRMHVEGSGDKRGSCGGGNKCALVVVERVGGGKGGVEGGGGVGDEGGQVVKGWR